MTRASARPEERSGAARDARPRGLETIHARHTCAHRVDELLSIVERLRAPALESVGMKIAFYGSSLLSSYWNGAATYYRGLLRDLASRGYDITFYEPDAYERQQHRDMDPPPMGALGRLSGDGGRAARRAGRGARRPTWSSRPAASACSTTSCSPASSTHARPDALKIFWDVDAAATLDEMRARRGSSGAPRAAVARPRADLWRRAAGRRSL